MFSVNFNGREKGNIQYNNKKDKNTFIKSYTYNYNPILQILVHDYATGICT
jgi:hypothetical protein